MCSTNAGRSSEKLDLQPPKGTRDFYPEDMRLRNWLFGHWKEVASLYGFDEYDAPVLENEALYIRKAGEEVTQQLYNFEDKGERRVALRVSTAADLICRRPSCTCLTRQPSLLSSGASAGVGARGLQPGGHMR